jgi:two-component system, chemotaxis family, protein-glutamate methylesterase/glutaminase
MGAIRILVVEDSTTVRKHLCQVLAGDRDLEVVAEACDGRQAIERCRTLRPDVVTMDMMLPVMSGLSATEYIMAHCPTPILIVSSSTNRGELFKTYEALAAGAIDVLEKPLGDDTDAAWEAKFIATVKLISRIRAITHPRARLRALGQAAVPTLAEPGGHARRRCTIVALGASTGGPAALVEILAALPSSFPVPVLLVLHIAEPFAASFADWLNGHTRLRVSYAREGELISARAGEVVMAPPESHLTVRAGRVRLTMDGERHSCRPSVDVLFESVALDYGGGAVGCLLTGMGRDGADGLLQIRRAGGFTIAQDEATSVVYGMPREAVRVGAAESILPLGDIASTLITIAGPARERVHP